MPTTPIAHTFPAAHILQLVELVRRWKVSSEDLLQPFGLQIDELERPGARIALATLVSVTERARTLTGEPGLGIYLGLQKQISAYGFAGFAAMSASTLGEALQQAVDLAPAISGAVGLSLRVEGDTAALVVHEFADIGSIRDIALLSLFVGFRHMTLDLTAREFVGDLELVIPEPPYFRRFAHILPNTHFGRAHNQLLFTARALGLPLTRPNRAALNLARSQCLEQLAQLDRDASLPGHVRQAMTRDDGFRNIEDVASILGLSVRTLKRRLAEHGLTFTEILEDERKHRALHLLGHKTLTLDQISERLGYASVSSFARAFARWTGESPASYRRKHGSDVLG